MSYLHAFDYVVIVLYFLALVALGFYLQKKASSSVEDYFLGGRRLPWWALGASGMASWFDIAGTMIIVSFLYILGPRGLFVEFRGGAGLLLPFMMLWVGKWMRRSQCLTPAEWMIFRFGDGPGGRFAQLASAIGAIVTTVGMLAYLVKGVGLFLSTFLPLPPWQCALLLVAVATLYTMVSGFYGVVFTDVFQSVIILSAVGLIGGLAISKISACPDFGALATTVTGQEQWLSGRLPWTTHMPAGYEMYRNLFMFAVFYVLNNLFRGMGFPGDPKYFGARNDRECGTLSLMWVITMMFRWPLSLGFAILGIFLVRELYPDLSTISQAVDLIQEHFPNVVKSRWVELLSQIRANPAAFPPDLIAGLQDLFGAEGWRDRLYLLSFEGNVNPERILPTVLLFDIPGGLRGLMLVALVAASMSTFDSTVNATTAMMTRDIYQKYLRPHAQTRELIYISWCFVLLLVTTAFLFGYALESINSIWGWIVMGLGAGVLVPSFLRLYWWRFNGGGFAMGTFAGIIAAVLQRTLTSSATVVAQWPWLARLQDERVMFCVLLICGLIGSIIGTYMSPPTDSGVLGRFYRQTRPFGLWGPLARTLSPEERRELRREHLGDLLPLPFAFIFQVMLYLTPMLLMVQNWAGAAIAGALLVVGGVGLYVLWFSRLPAGNPPVEAAAPAVAAPHGNPDLTE